MVAHADDNRSAQEADDDSVRILAFEQEHVAFPGHGRQDRTTNNAGGGGDIFPAAEQESKTLVGLGRGSTGSEEMSPDSIGGAAVETMVDA